MKRKLHIASALLLSSLVSASPAFASCAITDLTGKWNAMFTWFGTSQTLPAYTGPVSSCTMGVQTIVGNAATWPFVPGCVISQVTITLTNATTCQFTANFTWRIDSHNASFIPHATLYLFLNENQNILSGVGFDDVGNSYTSTWVSYN